MGMKNIIFRMVSILSVMAGVTVSHAADVSTVTERIDQIIYDELPVGTDIGVYVYDLTTDSVLYAYRENVLFRPGISLWCRRGWPVRCNPPSSPLLQA